MPAAKTRLLKIDYANLLAQNIGPQAGLASLAELQPRVAAAHQHITARRQAGSLAFFDLPLDTRGLKPLRKLADQTRERIDNLVVLGIGGSALGASALFQALAPRFHNLLDRPARRFPRLFVLDNVDPEEVSALLRLVDPRKTVFNVISKSGSTTETISQLMVVLDRLKKSLGRSSVAKHLVVTTDPEKGFLRQFARREGCLALDVPEGVGGRFSVFTPVGLFPLAVVGVNLPELIKGAAWAAADCSRPELKANPAYLFAALAHAMGSMGRSILVMMPYAASLGGVVDWFCQLWAESLGKAVDLEGRRVNAGQTPIRAMGATDQHSQLQLYMEGPADKLVVFLGVENYRLKVRVPHFFKGAHEFSYLGGRQMSEIIQVEQASTARALALAGRPNMTLTLPRLTPASLGYLLFTLEAATVTAGALLGIDPLDQPGVELSKKFIHGLLGRAGFEKYKKDFEAAPRAQELTFPPDEG